MKHLLSKEGMKIDGKFGIPSVVTWRMIFYDDVKDKIEEIIKEGEIDDDWWLRKEDGV